MVVPQTGKAVEGVCPNVVQGCEKIEPVNKVRQPVISSVFNLIISFLGQLIIKQV